MVWPGFLYLERDTKAGTSGTSDRGDGTTSADEDTGAEERHQNADPKHASKKSQQAGADKRAENAQAHVAEDSVAGIVHHFPGKPTTREPNGKPDGDGGGFEFEGCKNRHVLSSG